MALYPLEQDQQPATGFIPLSGAPKDRPRRGFMPLQAEPERPSIAKQAALENPATAIAETGLNLASQAVALPVAGLAGLATEAGNALGLTKKKGADVVHSVGEALTYQPRGEMGKQATELATYPFQKLAEAGQYLGGKTLEAIRPGRARQGLRPHHRPYLQPEPDAADPGTDLRTRRQQEQLHEGAD